MRLTDLSIRALPPPQKGQKLYRDDTLPGFGCRVSVGGTKTFVLVHGQDRAFLTLGRYPILTLSQAREEARRFLAEKTLGRVRPQSVTFDQAVKLFLDEKRKNRRARTVHEYERHLKYLRFKGQLIDLNHDEVARRLGRIKKPGEHHHALVVAKTFFTWAQKRRYIEYNPTTGLSSKQSTPRSRVLTDAELQLIWRACEQTGEQSPVKDPSFEEGHREKTTTLVAGNGAALALPRLPTHFATIVKLLILTGQRRGEIAALRVEYFSLGSSTAEHSVETRKAVGAAPTQDTCTLPPTLTKNKREHTFPVGEVALSALASTLNGGRSMLFPARGTNNSGNKCFNGWSKAKTALDEISGVTNWTLHDIRRTYATKMADLGVAPHIIERLLNHITGQISGVAAIYNRARYITEMSSAVSQYEAHLKTVLKLP